MKHQGTHDTVNARQAWQYITQNNLDMLLAISNALEEEREGYEIGGDEPRWPNVGDQQKIRCDLLEICRVVMGSADAARTA